MRRCMRCGALITKSDGGVLARDLIAFHDGKIKGADIRETCGLCVLRPDAIEYLEQIPSLAPTETATLRAIRGEVKRP